MSSKRPIAFNVLLSEAEFRDLTRVAELYSVPRSIIIRQLIHSRKLHDLDNHPVCASGTNCMCPHLLNPTFARNPQ